MQPVAERERRHLQRVDEIFTAVIEAPPPDQSARLDVLCGSDAVLRADVARLLDSRSRVKAGFLEPPAALPPPSSDLGGEPPSLHADLQTAQRWIGRRIGRFTLGRCLAVGGMGAVYEAVQDRPRRTVALKLILGALASPQRLRRFVTEAEILADLHHPHIAQVYEAGTGDESPDAAPYMALELIPDASPITEFVRREKLGRRARLELFLQVCEAVQYVHQRGVIHRDLKPANILVDSAGHPRVIDFGVARLAGADGGSTRLTEARQLVGTLAYMSPEQVRGDPAEIDARSDVYALGMLLFELLTGRLPYELGRSSLPEAMRAIESAEPPQPASLDRSLRGDLQTIMLKALEKRPDKRYASVEALAEDLRRFLDGRPINARTPTLGYQLAQLVRRHRAAAAVAAVLLLVGAGFAVTVTLFFFRSERARVQAERSQTQAEEAQRSERAQAERARTATATVLAMLQELDPISNPTEEGADDAGVPSRLERLKRYAGLLNQSLRDEPRLHADVLLVLGDFYARFRHFDESAALALKAAALRRDLPGATRPYAEAMLKAGAWSRACADYPRAETCNREVIELAREHFGADDPLILAALRGLVRVVGQRDVGEADALLNEALELAQRRPQEQKAIIGDLLMQRGYLQKDPVARRASYEQALELFLEALGDDAPQTHLVRKRLAALEGPSEYETAIFAVLERRRATFPATDPRLADALQDAAHDLANIDRPEAGEALLREALAIRRQRLGPDSSAVEETLNQLARNRDMAGDVPQAIELQCEAVQVARRAHGTTRPGALCSAIQNLMMTLYGSDDEADHCAPDEYYADALRLHDAAAGLPSDHPLVSCAGLLMGEVELRRRCFDRAEMLLSESVALRTEVFGPTHPLTTYAKAALGRCLTHMGRFDEAHALLSSAHAHSDSLPRFSQIKIIRFLVELCEASGRDDEAAAWRAMLKKGDILVFQSTPTEK